MSLPAITIVGNLTRGIEFNSRLSGIDDRRLCRDCAKEAGWER